jgi:iron complex outermembrane receptor protein
MTQAGFRADWTLAAQRGFTLQGDVYGGETGQRSPLTTYNPPALTNIDGDTRLSGGNILARWHDASRRLQIYYDRTNRTEPTFREFRDTVDVDFQHLFVSTARHQILWGAGARVSAGDIASVETQRFLPEDRTDRLVHGFVQDEITIAPDRLRLTFGAKIERNSYSGVEMQPSGRVLWTPGADEAVFASVARAVRTPSRVEQDFERTVLLNAAVPLFLRLVPNYDFVSEKLIAYEAGYRFRPIPTLYLTTAVFLHHVADILSTEPGPNFVEATPAPAHTISPVVLANGLHGNTRGLEVTADLRPRGWLRWTGTYSLLRIELARDPDSRDLSQEARGERLNPRHQVHSHVSLDVARRWEVDWLFRFVDQLPTWGVPAYTTSDLRLSYRLTPAADVAVIGRDLHHARHLEFPGGGVGNVEVERSVYAKVTFRR